MLVINAGGKPQRSERLLRNALKPVRGILLLNAFLETSNGRTREVDGILFTPTRTYTIEVKGTQLSGETLPHSNKPWTIGGEEADFYGGPNPLRQTRTGAQMLAAVIQEAQLNIGFIEPVVAVSGNNIELQPTKLGDTWAFNLDTLAADLPSPSSNLLSAETVQTACELLGVELTHAQISQEGFPGDGIGAQRTHRNTLARKRARATLNEAFSTLPGVVVEAPHSKAPTGSDHHAVAVTPDGVFAIKQKSTTLRGEVDIDGEDWTIGGRVARLGKTNPAAQARGMATWLRKSLERDHGINVPVHGIVTLTGGDHELDVTRKHGAWVCRTSDIAGVLLRNRPRTLITIDQAAAVLGALGHDYDRKELAAAGFTQPEPTPAPDPAKKTPTEDKVTSRQRHRNERLLVFQEQAYAEWRTQNRRRLIGTLAACAPLIAALALITPKLAIAGVVFAAIEGCRQLVVRRRLKGPRDSSLIAAIGWLFTLTPVVCLGTVAASAMDFSAWDQQVKGVLLMLHITTAAFVVLCTLAGRSSFIYPPPVVLERHGRDGKPVGAFRIARNGARRAERNTWRPAEN